MNLIYNEIKLSKMQGNVPNLKSLVSTTRRRGLRAKTTPPLQPGASPNESKPMSPLSPKCPKEVKFKSIPATSERLSREAKAQLSDLARRQEAKLPYVIIEEALFTIYSKEEIKAISVVKVKSTDLFGPNTVNDTRMGPTDSTSRCSTCAKTDSECPGHPGYIQLPKKHPFIHPFFWRETIMVLRSVCNSCGGLLLTREELHEKGILRKTGISRLKAIEEASKGLICRHEVGAMGKACVQNPTYLPSRWRSTNKIIYKQEVEGEEIEGIMTPSAILDIFQAISQEDANTLGYANGAHPVRNILEVLMVIPPVARPASIRDGRYVPDPLTEMYIDIVRHNNNLRNFLKGNIEPRKKGQRRPKGEQTLPALEAELYLRIKNLISMTDGQNKGGGTPLINLGQLINTKEGIVRGNIMGKRNNYSARTVLSPDPTLAFGQLAVPRAFAPILTPVETVNRYNKESLQNLFEKGRITYVTFSEKPIGEAPSFRFPGRRTQVVENIQKNYTLQDGDIVERWLEDGDIVIFNRQPTLTRYSFMGYRVVLRDQKTFGLHLSYTTPLNADFDGDEGNLFILNILSARAEAETLMNVKNCLISSINNKPTMGIVFDGLVGVYLLTQPDTVVESSDYYDALTYLTEREQLASLPERMEKYNVPYTIENEEGETGFSGRALFSALLPEDFYYEGSKGVIIQEGVLVNGVVTKDHVGTSKNSIIQNMSMYYPVERVANFLTDTSYILNRWLQGYGFSLRLTDCLVQNPEIEENLKEAVGKARSLVSEIGVAPAEPTAAQKHEEQIIAYVGAPKETLLKELEAKVPKENAFNIGVLSGAKGNVENLAQIAYQLGQVHISEKRVGQQLTYGTRCLPYFDIGDQSIEARGFCTSSFLKGLTPAEMYFHQMAGRQGLLGQALSTQETGYMHRKEVKALQDIKTTYDGSVRNVDNTLFEYIYGDDGFEPSKLKEVETKSGKFLSFVDAKNLAKRINGRYGF